MSSRPRRSAAQRATEAITDMADRDNERVMSSRSRRSGGAIASVSRGPPSSPASSVADSNQHVHLMVKVPPSKLRQATNGNSKRSSAGSSVAVGSSRRGAAGTRTRGGKKSYIVESDSDEEDEEEEEEEEEVEELAEIEVGNRAGLVDVDDEEEEEEEEEEDEEMAELGEEDAEGEVDDEMDVDAEGEDDDENADADGDIDMDILPPPVAPPAIKISKPTRGVAQPVKRHANAVAKAAAATKEIVNDDDDDDDELSELESDPEEANEAVRVAPSGEEEAEGEDDDADVDAEGEEIEVADEDAEGEDDEEELDSDDETGSRAETPDLTKLTARQRAKIGGATHEYMKLSDEVQAKKVFTAEELSMRRAEMARRRRNLSEKRNEEVKMETINKLLKKQAPKTNRRNALLAGDETPDEMNRADPLFVRWISSKDGNRIAVPDEMLIGPSGRLFGARGTGSGGKLVQEVS
ncbi:PAPA-1-like conserved region-domain-containing protein [Apodospora peruviana]|uniref:PAPA-1-like conserved region-domain-containing protein n=1 Tax=Apodospora peruviana TaxID=516989 RepID=A0AAE0HYM5_9PEZI|nr:PAPA-1-like conserved region-domain-containing protein [Apodospora peruviana]